MTLIGRRLLLTYDNHLEITGLYRDGAMDWEGMTGPAKGMTGTEKTHAREVAPGVFFVSWLEASGTTVSQILDLNAMKVCGFVTWASGAERQSMFAEGRLTELS
jgi:phenolic acid decarboxylase